MLSPSAGFALNPMDTRDVEGAQPAGAPVHVSRTNTFCVVPGVSVMPSAEASTNTAYRLSSLMLGFGSESIDAETAPAIWASVAVCAAGAGGK
jgi:hypothetical protein